MNTKFTKLCRRPLAAAIATLALGGVSGAAVAQAKPGVSDDVVKIGLLLDLSGVYADIAGQGTATAVQMAIDDFGGKVNGKKIELVFADHNNKADIAAAKAREWFDTAKVDAVLDVAGSATALSALEVARAKHKIMFFNGPGVQRITTDLCAPTAVHYAYDTYALANVTAKAMAKRGGDTWYFMTVDWAFGVSLQKAAEDVVKEAGGKVLGSVKHPSSAPDFSSYVLQAQASGAKVIGLANSGADTVNSIKAAQEFGLMKSGKQKLAGLLLFINDIHAIGLPTAQGLILSEAFYWDLNPETRAWSKRYFEKSKRMPNMIQAGAYSSTMQYLNAIKATGTDDTDTVMKKLKSTPINDFFAKNGKIREDGRMVHDMYLFEVKKPSESKSPWDYYKVLSTVPGDQAFMPLSKSTCPLVKK
ncbi:ABC transporter substrate-binding protein [Noviherbaspirillum sedimenti]|uniref:ABC transporter substrate-binding protein n=1 Tax=Noviherbaspirillum sedimenti TaxID=2320865 RepID=A0A3A3G591_9BURK|nr:ABC transporter substrate-binding protein [Noviherbaspirillum sedimenti]RJG02845.1 ABC transporter substrate-binding protein [Noviherbaspirillum sedimenti]